MSNKILITGGAGFIGSHLAEKLLQEREEVFVIDDLSTGSLKNIEHLKDNNNFHFLYRKDIYREDELNPYLELKANNFNDDFFKEGPSEAPKPITLTDDYPEWNDEKKANYMKYIVGKVIKDKKIDEIYHLAATVGVKLVLENPLRCIRNNVIGTDIVLNQAAKNQKNGKEIKVLVASSSEVCGKNDKPPFGEKDNRTYGSVYNHRWVYAFSKGIDEFLGLAHCQENGLPVIIVRFFNVIGPRQTGYYGMVVPTLVQQAIRGEPLTVYGDGEQTRCFADVEDVVSVLIDLMTEKKAIGKVINLGSDREISINKLAEEIKKQTGSASKIVLVPYEQAYGDGFEDFRRRVPDLTIVKNLINYQPKFTLEESLKKIIDYLHGK